MAYQGKKNNYQKRNNSKFVNKNQQIPAGTIMLIDQNGDSVGEISVDEAQKMANAAELDLVEVGAKADPRVCKIMDFSKYMYEQKRKAKENKKKGKVKPMKEFRFSPVIDIGDINVKSGRAKEYLDKGHNVRVTMQRRGRQTREQAEDKFIEILTKFEGYSTIEPEPKREGRKIFITYKSDGTAKKSKNSTKKTEKDQSKGQKKA